MELQILAAAAHAPLLQVAVSAAVLGEVPEKLAVLLLMELATLAALFLGEMPAELAVLLLLALAVVAALPKTSQMEVTARVLEEEGDLVEARDQGPPWNEQAAPGVMSVLQWPGKWRRDPHFETCQQARSEASNEPHRLLAVWYRPRHQ